MTQNEYGRIAYALHRLASNTLYSREQHKALLDSAISLIADVLQQNSRKFHREQFYLGIYDRVTAINLLEKEKQANEQYITGEEWSDSHLMENNG